MQYDMYNLDLQMMRAAMVQPRIWLAMNQGTRRAGKPRKTHSAMVTAKKLRAHQRLYYLSSISPSLLLLTWVEVTSTSTT